MLWLCRGGGCRVPGRLGGWILCAILVEGDTGNVGGDPYFIGNMLGEPLGMRAP